MHELLSSSRKRVHMLGVDLDPILVQRANEKLVSRGPIQFQTVNVMDTEQRDQIWRQYLNEHTGHARFDVTPLHSVSFVQSV